MQTRTPTRFELNPLKIFMHHYRIASRYPPKILMVFAISMHNRKFIVT